MSRVLERLRKALNDPLMLRAGSRYERTPRGERLLVELNQLLPRLEEALRGKQFDPSASEERYRLAMTDYACVVILPSVLKSISSSAPGCRVDVSPWHDRCFEDLATGRLDMIVTVAGLGRPMEFRSESIFTEKFVCVVADRHPIRGSRISISEYLSQRHIVVNVGQGKQTLVDLPLDHRSLKREVGASLPFFAPAILLAANSDMVLTVPSRLVPSLGTTEKIRVLKAPSEIPGFKYEMIWSPRVDGDPSHQWLRDQIRAAGRAMPR